VPDAAVDGRVRAVIENVTPSVDAGRFAAKRVAGDRVVVEADCFADGHDAVAARLLWRRESEQGWQEAPMAEIGNDRWRGSFMVDTPGRYRYAITAWIDAFASWRRDLARREDPGDLRTVASSGAALAEAAAARASGADRAALAEAARALRQSEPATALKALGRNDGLAVIAARHPDRRFATTSAQLPLVVDGARAGFGTWYELFPRSTASTPDRHGTLRDCEARLGYIAAMGFDVVYLPPIHPIGRTHRKGRNNAAAAAEGDVGSPWAIGAPEGGHTAVHPQLGTLAEFRRFVAAAREHGLAVALDIAFQCSPDHPYVTAHPEWFRHRPDGSIQYAENPPKKYQDIYPFDFECADWRRLWIELKQVLEFWIAEGVSIFRVDNPHTKAFGFWEWVIAEVKRTHPEAIFLAEAFTRPKVMHRLAKIGFTHSYTYFAWRNTKRELTEYFLELAHAREYFRPHLWPNTPDILSEYLQFGGRPAFMARLVLAATLGASYGIYGPAFELAECAPRAPGSEEYLDSEKYQLRTWDLDRADSLAAFIGRVNRARRENPALQNDVSLEFVPVDNEQLIAYTKSVREPENAVLTVVNLDPHHVQSGWVELDLEAFGMDANAPYQMHDLISGARYLWNGRRNFIQLDPARTPAHVFVLRRRVRSERDFDYFF
jgi:starch synthase (maltosyl-transferring)